MRPLQHQRLARSQQKGIALFVVIIFVMLSMLLALWASRTALFNEMVVSNDADYQRAFEAAQALLQDAELDIRGEQANGKPCVPSGDVCRATTKTKYPISSDDTPIPDSLNPGKFLPNPDSVKSVIQTLDAAPKKCLDGICTRRTGRQDFWNYTDDLSPAPANIQPGEFKLKELTKTGIGARYGQYTGALKSNNPILNDTSADDKGGWYWVEIIPYVDADKTKNKNLIVSNTINNQLKIKLDVYVVYRITALAYGRKPGTMVVLQQTYARERSPD